MTRFAHKPTRSALLPLLLAASISLTGCGGDSEDSTADGPAGDAKLTIGVIPKTTSGEFWETVRQGVNAAEKDLDVKVRYEGTQTATAIAEQNKIIENMINLGIDGLVLAPLNQKAMKKSVQNTVDAGIPVVIFDSGVDGDAHTSFVATDNTRGGAMGAEGMSQIAGDLKGKKFLVLRFVQGTASTEARAQGFIEAVKAAGGEIIADPYPEDGTVAGAKKTSANVLEGLVDGNTLKIDGVFAANLETTLGMAAALDDLQKSGITVDTNFVGFDTSPKLVQLVQEGKIDALVAQNPERMGYLAVESMVKHLRGETVEPFVETAAELVTQEKLKNDPAIRKLVGLK